MKDPIKVYFLEIKQTINLSKRFLGKADWKIFVSQSYLLVGITHVLWHTYVYELLNHILHIFLSSFEESNSQNSPAKMAKMWIFSGQWSPWPATGAGHGPDGSTPRQYRWADVVWAPCCHDCVMGCCGVLVDFHWPLVARGSHILHLGLGLLRARLLGLCCTAAFPLIFLQLRKGPL